MNIEHRSLLSCVYERKDATKTKNHAQDGGMLSAMRYQHPAILPWFLVLGWRPSFRVGPGHLARHVHQPDCRWTHDKGTICFLPLSIIACESRTAASRTIMQKRAPGDARILHDKLNA
jgi:hypothetical protein